MSKAVLSFILSEMRLKLSEMDVERLYREIIAYFGLIGATNECKALEEAWIDPYNRRKIEDFIMAWLRRRRKVEKALVGVA